jgi:ABC-type branched-subunit amino acid transport system substrate-binding protein
MAHHRMRLLAGASALLIAVAGCGSSSKTGSGSTTTVGSAPSSGGTYTVGVLTDQTGIAASASATTVKGVAAGIVYAAHNGYTIKYDLGDTQSSAPGALAAAQKLVQQDHVLAVITVSAFAYGAAAYLAGQHVPVIGLAEDGPEWQSIPTMFSTFGAIHTDQVTSTDGLFMKMEGVTSVGAVGYSISPSSSQAAATAAKSAQDAGLKVGYLNTNFPFGSTNVGPEVIAMKSGGVDGLVPTVDPNTAFSLIGGLRQAGANLKVALLPTGYGGDLLQAGPGALQAAQGVFFSVTFEPVEMHDAATQQFQADLTSAGVTTEPTYAEYGGYTSMGLLVQGLKAAGANATQTSLTTALSGIHNWNALGLFGSRTLDINNHTDPGFAPGGACVWVVKLAGTGFQLVPGADPICGSYTGQKVS